MLKYLLLIHLVSNSIVITVSDQKNSTNAHSLPQSLNFPQRDLLLLSEMPLEQLLKVKKSLDDIQLVSRQVQANHNYELFNANPGTTLESRIINDDTVKFELDNDRVQNSAMPLININQSTQKHQQQPPPPINRKSGYSDLEGPWNTKPSKIQTFFQISVTALAFLAFAGYLLCMIVQAIKSKGTTLLMTNANMPLQSTSSMNGINNSGSVPLRRRRRPISIGRRRKRNVFLSSDNHNDTISSLYNESLNIDGDMYHAMLSIAEGYVKFQQFE